MFSQAVLALVLVASAATQHQGHFGVGQAGFGGRPNAGGFSGQAGGFSGQTGGFRGQAGGFGGQTGGFGGQAGGFGGQTGGFGGQAGGFGGQAGGFGGRPNVAGFGGSQSGFGQNNQAGLTGAQNPALQYNCQATASQGQYGIDATCKQFCKAPQQYWGGKYVCCEDRNAVCPPIRATCPRFSGQGPTCCFVDSQCEIPTHKCCFDTCLGHKVCKEAGKRGF